MASIINASATNGIVQTADGSGLLKVQSGGVTTNALAWVNFNGTGTVAIRSSYNVSSITDGGTGVYTVNFSNVMSDNTYSCIVSTSGSGVGGIPIAGSSTGTYLTTSVGVRSTGPTSFVDNDIVCVAIFGN